MLGGEEIDILLICRGRGKRNFANYNNRNRLFQFSK